ncbi:MAG: carotenoid oxygenase family protein [Sphingomonadales bacterium]|nr:carotenoid oxygenase family protein [Sphingomonadales bacterium]MDE2568918.1 carotenoid oxygenase family protein [Sphingomonadales bacterium]
MASTVEETIRGFVGKGIELVSDFNRSRRDRHEYHPFLEGIHAPMIEERSLAGLEVTGTIPAGLAGRYVRIGPNPYKPDPRGHHWFVGDGMVHGVRLKDGKAEWYRNRWIRSRALEAEGGPKAAPGPRHGAFDTVNTNVLEIGGRTMALVEAGGTPVLLTDDLDSQSYSDFDGTLQGAFSAHPHLDPATGEQHAITYQSDKPNLVHHVVVSPEGKVIREEAIPVEHGPSIHDCTITDRYVLVFDLPVTLSMKALIGGERFPYHWNRQHKARVGLLPRKGFAEEIVWCDVDPCYVFHVANSYDREDGAVVVDLVAYDTMFDGTMPGPKGNCRGLERWVIDPATRAIERSALHPALQEFPRADERFFGKPYSYCWSVGIAADPAFMGAEPLFRHDLATGQTAAHDFGEGRIPGEFVFVPRTPDAPEGEGWIVGYVIDPASETSELVILDASDMAAEPVARVRIPHRIPPGFHGNWIADT